MERKLIFNFHLSIKNQVLEIPIEVDFKVIMQIPKPSEELAEMYSDLEPWQRDELEDLHIEDRLQK